MYWRKASFLVILSLFYCALAMPSWAATFLGVEREGSADVLTLAVGSAETHKVFFLPDPDRLVVDFPHTVVPSIALPANYNGELIKSVRSGRFNATTVRIVFDLHMQATLVTKTLESGVLTLSIAPGGKPGSKKAAAVKDAPKPKPQKPLVIIDPGHGGSDPGAIGPRGSLEKDIVLTFAKALEDALVKTGRYRVMLTRENDRFIPLRERVRIGRASKGSIFISIHADSAPNNMARGLSVYTLSEKASDAEAEALAVQENKSDIIGGMDLSHEREDVADILISLAQRETRNQSALLADQLVLALDEKVLLLNNAHRMAGFAVLKAPDIPSVLVETGFISHPAEEKLLKTKNYRQKLISGMVQGIDKYFAKQGTAP